MTTAEPAQPARCTGTTRNGIGCRRPAIGPFFVYCKDHDPAQPADSKPAAVGAAVANGNRQRAVRVAAGQLRCMDDVFNLLERAARLAQQGKEAQARVLVQAANSARAAIEKNLEGELARLRALVEERFAAEARQ